MDNDSEDLDIQSARGPIIKVLPLVVVIALPLVFGVWWWSNREPVAAEVPAVSVAKDPWETLNKTIYPQGKIHSIDQTDEFTYLYVRFTDADRWVATQTVDFKVGDTVQIKVDPLAVKTNFKAKSLGRVFPKIVLVGSGGVKLMKARSTSQSTDFKS